VSTPPPYGGYPPPPYPSVAPYGYPPPRPTNGFAVASLICAFLAAPLGIIFGHVSLSQIKRTGEDGRGLAIAGLIIGYLVTIGSIIALVVMVVFTIAIARELDNQSRYDSSDTTASPLTPSGGLPDFDPPPNLGANCAYPTTTEKASKPNRPPRSGRVPTDPDEVSASMSTNRGPIGIQLDNDKAPCTVNSFASLAQQGYFDGTSCHRLTTSPQLGVLQCGDPSGTGEGGPGLEDAGDLPARHTRDGQRGLRHQRQPVLPRLHRLETTADLHGVRHHRRHRVGHARHDRRRGGGRWQRRRQARDGRDHRFDSAGLTLASRR
jgi:peptidyl-prolyl cis-trans isomerase B (cyclophilin B)